MFVRRHSDCEEFVAADETILREPIHPDKADLALRYSIVHAIVKPHKRSLLHRLKTSEVYYILEGEGIMHIDEETEKVGPGDTIYIPPNGKQYIENTGDSELKFLAIVDPAWRPEDEEVL